MGQKKVVMDNSNDVVYRSGSSDRSTPSSEGSSDREETVLSVVPFLKEDARWSGTVSVVKRKVKQADGSFKEFVDMRLQLGKSPRYMPIPRRGVEEITAAMHQAKAIADTHFQKGVLARSTTKSPRGHRREKK